MAGSLTTVDVPCGRNRSSSVRGDHPHPTLMINQLPGSTGPGEDPHPSPNDSSCVPDNTGTAKVVRTRNNFRPWKRVKGEDMSRSVQSVPKAEGKALNIALWALQVILAVLFVMVGASKMAGAQDMVKVFRDVGVGQWLRYVTGSLELAGAVLLLVPRLSALGGLVLTGVMTGAVLTCLFVIDQNPLPAAVLLILAAVVMWNRRQLTLGIIGKA